MALTVSQGRWQMAPHHSLVDEAVCDLIHRRIPQRILMVREPPRHGKSEHLCHWTPAWYLGSFPDKEVIVAGHGGRFARKWGRRSRNTFEMVAPAIFPTQLDPDRQAADNWGTIHGGGCITTGVSGGIGGEGAGLLLIDDLIKNSQDAQSEAYREEAWDWFRSTALTRLAPDGVCVVVGTSWHRDDYQQRIRREFADEVFEICLPAIAEEEDELGRKPGEALWPERWPLEWLNRQKLIQGQYYWNALYQQKPSQHEHAEWPSEHFEDIFSDYWPDLSQRIICVVALDPSKGKTDKSDFSALVAVALGHDGKYYVDADIERRALTGIVEHSVQWMLPMRPDAFGCEINQFQELLKPAFEAALPQARMSMTQVFGINNDLHKDVRIRRLSYALGQHRIKIKPSRGGKRLVEQLRDFPLGDYDDGPDALEMAIRLAEELLNGGNAEPEPELLYA
jgi:predicted phage terminase large subunit-like protein